MKRLRILAVLLAIVSFSSVASASVFFEDFESYAPGSALHGQGGWKGWDNTPGAGAPVSDAFAYSGSNAVEIVPAADLVHEFDLTGGLWILTAMQYIPSGTSGTSWFILLNTYNDGGAKDWSVQTQFDLGAGTISYWHGGSGQIVYDQWIELKYVIDLDNNTVDKYYNGEFIVTDTWDDNNHGTLQVIDLYGNNASSIYYDDIKIEAPAHAYSPQPADGAMLEATWVTLKWSPGREAASHDVYLSEDFDAVNERSAEAFRGNQMTTFYVAGFPGFAYSDGLVPGTTYFWRVDEINEQHPDSPWRGDVWSFTVTPYESYAPIPANRAKFIDPDNPTLSWSPGFGAKLHTVYFGDNFDDVNSAVGGLPQAMLSYSPGPLEREKDYYWRVDEFDGTTTYKGDVWTFTTARAGGGVKGQYFKGMNFNTLVLTRTDPQINFNWGSGEPDPAVGADNFSVRWTGEVEAAFTETYTFYTNSDDGVRLWIGGKQLVNNWTDHAATENRGTIDLVAGKTYSLLMEMYENGGSAVAQLYWSSLSTPKQAVPQAALSLPVKAGSPRPADGATGTRMSPILRWHPGDFAASHEVYFGTDADAVANATKASPEFKATKALSDESYSPGKLAWHTTYYWRVDEVNDLHPASPWTGNVWSFTTGDFLVVDDFETYTNNDAAGEAIWQVWIDGFGIADNGAQVGYLLPPYAEQTIVHSGFQSMPLSYNNTAGVSNSEAVLSLVDTRDWTEQGVTELSMWFRGASGNAPEPFYIIVADGTGMGVLAVIGDPGVTQTTAWTESVIPLQALTDRGINLTDVGGIAIGLGSKGDPAATGGSGTMYIDDIRLYPPQ